MADRHIFTKHAATCVIFICCLVCWVMATPARTDRISSIKKRLFLAEVLSCITVYYVDPISSDSLLDGAIRGMLKTSRLNGTGIYLKFRDDTLVVHETTPSYSVDIGEFQKGDRILRVDGRKATGLHPDSLMGFSIQTADSIISIQVLRPVGESASPDTVTVKLHKKIIPFYSSDDFDKNRLSSIEAPAGAEGDVRSHDHLIQELRTIQPKPGGWKKSRKPQSSIAWNNVLFALAKHPKWQVLMDIERTSLDFYTDSLEQKRLIDAAVAGIFECLDPHSRYLPPTSTDEMTERIRGDFQGIGIRFSIQTDTLTIIEPIRGSPSDSAGLRSRDKFIAINDTSAIGLANSLVREKLRGPKGSSVDVTVLRPVEEEPFHVTLKRDVIPLFRVPYAFILEDHTGYVRIEQFSLPTAKELSEALDHLKRQGMKRLIIDLRGNQGGAMSAAYEVADLFLDHGVIVSQRGRQKGQEYFAQQKEIDLPFYPIIVMINHRSASSSEIVAGALQDWDRALIIGQTSFGKGLVQNPFPIRSVGGSLLLTVARYYTPLGRLIQRPYTNDKLTYIKEGFDDNDPNADKGNIKEDKHKYTTPSGRIVYGGGGITPDVTLTPNPPLTKLEKNIINNPVIFHFADAYITRHPDIPESFDEFFHHYNIEPEELISFRDYVRKMLGKAKIEFTDEEFERSEDFVRRRIKQEIARARWGSTESYRFWVRVDTEIEQALELFDQAGELLSEYTSSTSTGN